MNWLNCIYWYLGIHLLIWIYMRFQLNGLIEFQKEPENQKRWKVFIRKDLDDVKWYNFHRYLTYLPRFICMWFTVLYATSSAWVAIKKTTKPEKHKNNPTYLDDSSWELLCRGICWVGRSLIYLSGYSKVEKK